MLLKDVQARMRSEVPLEFLLRRRLGIDVSPDIQRLVVSAWRDIVSLLQLFDSNAHAPIRAIDRIFIADETVS